MKHGIRLIALSAAISCLSASSRAVELESFTYRQDFETRELSAWASYPLWQDTAYDPNFRVDTIVPGDPNISIVQTVTPYTNVDNYAGALRTVLMIDTIVQGAKDADVTLLYQTARLDDITPGNTMSSITVDSREHAIEDPNKFRGEVTRMSTVPTEKNVLFIRHLAPGSCTVEAVETPHYLNTLRNTRLLEREGMLTVTARTVGRELVMANLLTTASGGEPDIDVNEGEDCVTGIVNGSHFAFSKRPDHRYTTQGFETDALALTWNDGVILAALCRTLSADGRLLFESPVPLTCELNGNTIRYFSAAGTEAAIGIPARSAAVSVNGKAVRNSIFDAEPPGLTGGKAVVIELPAGEGVIGIH